MQAIPQHDWLDDPVIVPVSLHPDERHKSRRRKGALSLILLGIVGLLAAVWKNGGPRVPILGGSARGSDKAETSEKLPVSSHSQENQSKKPVHIIYSADDEAKPGVEASILSVLEHASGPVAIHYIGQSPLPNDYPEVHFKYLDKFAERFNLQDFMNSAYTRGHGQETLNTNAANFVRFGIDAMLPTQSKAIWIDADTIVKGDVYELINNVLNDDKYALAAVPRYGPFHGLSHYGDHLYEDIQACFNAGIYVMNLDNWRAQGLTDKIRQIARDNAHGPLLYKNGSQPPMAIAIGASFEHLDECWNVAMAQVEEINDEFWSNTCLMHWNGPYKPWIKGNKHKYLEELWKAYGIPQIRKPHHSDEKEANSNNKL